MPQTLEHVLNSLYNTLMTYRILLDKDSVVYDLATPWYAMHNAEYPDHILHVRDVDTWHTDEICKRVECPADIYKYFLYPEVWTLGKVLGNSNHITQRWMQEYAIELGFVTTVANPLAAQHSWKWLQKHFPHVPSICMVTTHIKSWIQGDILIDDGVHNLEHFSGIRILYTQPWNIYAQHDYISVFGSTDDEKWKYLDILVIECVRLLSLGYTHQEIMTMILTHQRTLRETKDSMNDR